MVGLGLAVLSDLRLDRAMAILDLIRGDRAQRAIHPSTEVLSDPLTIRGGTLRFEALARLDVLVEGTLHRPVGSRTL